MSLLDMIGPVMIGPSSSHTAGACRLGLVAHWLLGEAPRKATIGLHASFAKTGRGHGTHLALVAGLLLLQAVLVGLFGVETRRTSLEALTPWAEDKEVRPVKAVRAADA